MTKNNAINNAIKYHKKINISQDQILTYIQQNNRFLKDFKDEEETLQEYAERCIRQEKETALERSPKLIALMFLKNLSTTEWISLRELECKCGYTPSAADQVYFNTISALNTLSLIEEKKFFSYKSQYQDVNISKYKLHPDYKNKIQKIGQQHSQYLYLHFYTGKEGDLISRIEAGEDQGKICLINNQINKDINKNERWKCEITKKAPTYFIVTPIKRVTSKETRLFWKAYHLFHIKSPKTIIKSYPFLQNELQIFNK
jgi:hypothetical protein